MGKIRDDLLDDMDKEEIARDAEYEAKRQVMLDAAKKYQDDQNKLAEIYSKEEIIIKSSINYDLYSNVAIKTAKADIYTQISTRDQLVDQLMFKLKELETKMNEVRPHLDAALIVAADHGHIYDGPFIGDLMTEIKLLRQKITKYL